ncbi:MAG: hypothetical protein Q4G49_02335 [Paracoccus sp. (in: a-proteobacteria)]|nr:hypothetical protein [Paracoccus sp. (in: a-proteobacteria)]
MTGQEKENVVIVALRALCAAPGGNVGPRETGQPGTTIDGWPGVGAPPAAEGRPDLNDYRRVMRENTLLTDHAEMLACALGACPNCWGSIPDCEECGGAGRPGAFNPDPDMFARFVQPVIDRMTRATPDRGARLRRDNNRPMGFSA